jgi:hypothetical protein
MNHSSDVLSLALTTLLALPFEIELGPGHVESLLSLYAPDQLTDKGGLELYYSATFTADEMLVFSMTTYFIVVAGPAQSLFIDQAQLLE